MTSGGGGGTGRGGEKAEQAGRMHACKMETVAIDHHVFASFVAWQSGKNACQGIVGKQVGQDRQHWQNGVGVCIDWRARAVDVVYYSTICFFCFSFARVKSSRLLGVGVVNIPL